MSTQEFLKSILELTPYQFTFFAFGCFATASLTMLTVLDWLGFIRINK